MIGTALGLYASQRDCLIALITRGYMSFWTGVEILARFTALAGLISALVGLKEKIIEMIEKKGSNMFKKLLNPRNIGKLSEYL